MKKVTISKRSSAKKMIAKHPNASVYKFCTGKYKWHGSESHYVGQQYDASDKIVAIWVERRTDTHGPYALLMCLKEQ